jgi:hypothetical protein
MQPLKIELESNEEQTFGLLVFCSSYSCIMFIRKDSTLGPKGATSARMAALSFQRSDSKTAKLLRPKN